MDISGKEPKQRHGCLTVYLIFVIIVNALVALVYTFASGAIEQNLPDSSPEWMIPLMILLLVINIVGAIALFMWKKWGFFVLVGVMVISLVMNSIFLPNPTGIAGAIVGFIILWAALQIGGDKKGWTQLE